MSDALERAAVEVFESFADAGVTAILLKGPAVATWLYPGSLKRPYGDLDVLLAPAEVGTAERVLEDLGFAGRVFVGERGAPSSRIWSRTADDAVVDLHDRLVGVELRAEEAWRVLRDETESLALGPGSVTVLHEAPRALVVALAAAEKGSAAKPLQDLAAAVSRLPSETWQPAVELAVLLEATEALAAGLRLLPEGARLADSLRLPSSSSIDVQLRARAPTEAKGGALALAWIAGHDTWRGRARAVARVLAPSPAAMREAYPISRRGRAGLLAGYVWRLIVLTPRKIVPATRAYRAARRRSP